MSISSSVLFDDTKLCERLYCLRTFFNSHSRIPLSCSSGNPQCFFTASAEPGAFSVFGTLIRIEMR